MALSQIAKLAEYIRTEIPKEPSRRETVADCAIRLLQTYRAAMDGALRELGVPTDDYPAPVANAYEILAEALGDNTHTRE